jgi:hypothetical protein
MIEPYLPSSLKIEDSDGITKISQANFSHNMIPIINAFSSITITTLLGFIKLKS